MATWKSRGLRGSLLEEMINRTNDQYAIMKLALMQKIPTPITPIRMNQETRHITLAYFEQKSTVDYIGAVQGLPVCFDAKECAADTFPLANIHAHQREFMAGFEKQGGIAFILIYWKKHDCFYYLRFADLMRFQKRQEDGGRKSIRCDELDEGFRIISAQSVLIPYLDYIQKDLDLREA